MNGNNLKLVASRISDGLAMATPVDEMGGKKTIVEGCFYLKLVFYYHPVIFEASVVFLGVSKTPSEPIKTKDHAGIF